MTERVKLWTVIDPRGLAVSLAEDVWRSHTAYRGELVQFFDAVRDTVQEPDEIYFDPVSTAHRATGATVYWYYRSGLTLGRYAGNYLAVIVKAVTEVGGPHGYVESALVPDRIQKRLMLEWKR